MHSHRSMFFFSSSFLRIDGRRSSCAMVLLLLHNTHVILPKKRHSSNSCIGKGRHWDQWISCVFNCAREIKHTERDSSKLRWIWMTKQSRRSHCTATLPLLSYIHHTYNECDCFIHRIACAENNPNIVIYLFTHNHFDFIWIIRLMWLETKNKSTIYLLQCIFCFCCIAILAHK